MASHATPAAGMCTLAIPAAATSAYVSITLLLLLLLVCVLLLLLLLQHVDQTYASDLRIQTTSLAAGLLAHFVRHFDQLSYSPESGAKSDKSVYYTLHTVVATAGAASPLVHSVC
jgi:hypothetical protein